MTPVACGFWGNTTRGGPQGASHPLQLTQERPIGARGAAIEQAHRRQERVVEATSGRATAVMAQRGPEPSHLDQVVDSLG